MTMAARAVANRAGWAAFAVAGAAMVATPLLPRGRRRLASSAVVAGLAAVTTVATGRRWGAPRAALALSTVAALTTSIEKLGATTGIPFGRYRYSGALRPTVAGVPALVPLAWFAMALPARETAHAALGRHSSPVTRVLAGSAALAAWDLFLDPQMVAEGYWRWERPGRYRAIPGTNYLGWLVTGVALMALLEVIAPRRAEAGAGAGAAGEPALVGLYGWMAAMETVGFAAFFDDALVAAVGGGAMLPFAAVGGWRTWRNGRPARG